VTAVTEAVSRLLALRPKNLYKGIQNLLGEVGASSAGADQFFQSPIIKSLNKPGSIRSLLLKKIERRPGYIPAKRFYEGLIQSLGLEGKSLAEIEAALGTSPIAGDLKRNLQTFAAGAEADLDKFKANVEDWYDDSMDRVRGWFKRTAHTTTMIVAVVVTVAFNANTIKVAEVLWNDDANRGAVAKLADDFITNQDPNSAKPADLPTSPPADETEQQKLQRLQGQTSDAIERGKHAAEIIRQNSALPLGWEGENPLNRNKINSATNKPIPGWSLDKWISHLLGWTITAFALTLGAPFWFDTLKNLVNIRTSGAKPEKSAKAEENLVAAASATMERRFPTAPRIPRGSDPAPPTA